MKLRATWNGAVLAESDDIVTVEGNHYFPPESLRTDHLRPTGSRSVCPWKGIASYYDVVVGDDVNTGAAWSYAHPIPWVRRIKGRVAFWGGVRVEEVDAAVTTLDDESFLERTEGGITLVDFWAPWCGPCRVFARVFEEVAVGSDSPVRFARCNVDENPRTANMLHITSIPTVVAFGPDGSELGRLHGVPRRADLERALQSLEQHV